MRKVWLGVVICPMITFAMERRTQGVEQPLCLASDFGVGLESPSSPSPNDGSFWLKPAALRAWQHITEKWAKQHASAQSIDPFLTRRLNKLASYSAALYLAGREEATSNRNWLARQVDLLRFRKLWPWWLAQEQRMDAASDAVEVLLGQLDQADRFFLRIGARKPEEEGLERFFLTHVFEECYAASPAIPVEYDLKLRAALLTSFETLLAAELDRLDNAAKINLLEFISSGFHFTKGNAFLDGARFFRLLLDPDRDLLWLVDGMQEVALMELEKMGSREAWLAMAKAFRSPGLIPEGPSISQKARTRFLKALGPGRPGDLKIVLGSVLQEVLHYFGTVAEYNAQVEQALMVAKELSDRIPAAATP